MALSTHPRLARRRPPRVPLIAAPPAPMPPLGTSPGGGYLGQFDSYRVIACCAVVLQHSLLWNVAAGNTPAWAFVMLLHFSRTAFFFLTAFLLTYAEITRPRPVTQFWRRRFVELGMPFLAWTAIYWIYTMITAGTWGQAGSLLWHDLVFGYYQLYFVVVLFELYLFFPLLLRLLRRTRHHLAVMVASLLFALVLAADLHYTQYFGVVGSVTHSISLVWPWSRQPLTYQEQFVAGVLVALHFDEVRQFVERYWRHVVAAGRGHRHGGQRCGTWSRCGPALTPGTPPISTSRWPSCGSPPQSPRSSVGLGSGTADRCATPTGHVAGPVTSRRNIWPASPVASSSVTCSS